MIENLARTGNDAPAFPPLVWSEQYSVGVPALDAEHQLLFEVAGMLIDTPDPVEPRVTAQLLESLAEYAQVHFEREERYQASIGYPGLPGHRQHHRAFSAHIGDLQRQFAENPARVDTCSLRQTLRHWLVQHVMHEDMLFGQHGSPGGNPMAR